MDIRWKGVPMRQAALALAILATITPAPAQDTPPTFTGTTLIDQQIAKGWVDASVTNAGTSDDAAFLRRLSPDLVGHLPAPEEVLAFLKDTKPDKRAVKVDELLARPEYAQAWADVWETILVGYDEKSRNDSKRALNT